MKKGILNFLLLLYPLSLSSQNKVVCHADSLVQNKISVKWYFTNFTNKDGFDVYRKESDFDLWKKINTSPVVFNSYQPTKKDYAQDKELKNYVELASKSENIKDVVMVAVLIKSFKNKAFSKYLGLCVDDTSAVPGKTYEYKICSLGKKHPIDSAFSNSITAGKFIPIDPPKNIQLKTGNKKVSFTWLPEPNNYFGVNIYRQTNDSGHYTRITKDPILLSKTKNSKGDEVYGEEFYVDAKLKPHINYRYSFEALDFFGLPSFRSEPILVTLKDLDAPKAPDSIYHKVSGKKVQLKWKKKIKEEDLLGYNIYRTTNNDTDYVKQNFVIINKNDSTYTDTTKYHGSYMYALSSIDADGNESLSNPYFIEVSDLDAPTQPKNLIIKSDSGRLQLSWDKNLEKDLRGYLIYRTVNKNNEYTYVKITPTAIKENFFVDVLEKNIKNNFLYKVVAIDESLNRSPYSDFASARLPDITSPQAPFLKKVQMNEKSQLLLEWIPNTEPDLLGYNVFRKNLSDSSSEDTKLNIKILQRDLHKYTDRSFEQGNIYEYNLQANDSSGNISNKSNVLRIKVKKITVENEIIISSFDAKYNAKKNRVEVKWKIQNESSLKTSIVYKKKQNETVLSPFTGTLEDDKLTDVEIRKGDLYTYQLRVYNENGDVFKSENITIRIQ